MKVTTITITRARKDLFKIAEAVQEHDQFYSLTIDGVPQVVVMSQDSFESMMKNTGQDILMRDPATVQYRVKKRS